jgi:urease accessory protein
MIRRAALFLLIPFPAAAHGTLPGGGGFYAGVAHPFLAIEHFLLLLCLGLLLGHLGGAIARVALLSLSSAIVFGLAVGSALPFAGTAVLGLALITGLMVASGLSVKLLAPVLSVCAGVVIGADTGLPEAAPNAGPVVIAMPWIGVVVGCFLIAANAMALAGLVGGHSTARIALRIAGSWISAIALIVLAFRLSQGGDA